MALKKFVKRYEKYIFILACIVLFLFSTITLIRSVYSHYRFIAYPYQLEYREGGALIITQLYLNHQNPYSIEQQPQNTYVYGFLYPLAVSPFARIFGNTLFVHRSFTYFCIVATCLLVFLVLLNKKVNFFFAFAAMIILHQSLINAANTAIARPEGLGIFLFTLGIIIPWRWNFSWPSLVASILLGVLGYHAKVYYFLVIPFIATYLFIFVSKRKFLIYVTISGLLLLVTTVATSFVYQAYHNNTFFHQSNGAVYLYNYMKDQVAEYLEINVFLLVIIMLACVFVFREFLFSHLNETVKEVITSIRNMFHFNFNSKITRNEPLIRCNFDFLFAFVLLLSLILFSVKLGGHVGNFHAAYLFHLASPFLILVTFQMIEIPSSKIFKSVAAVLLIITMNLEFDVLTYDYKEFASCFKQVEDVIKKSKNPLNSPETVSIIVQENKPVYHSGLSEYFSTGISKLSLLTGASKGVSERTEKFKKEVSEKISRKEFDLILLTQNYYSFFVNPVLLKQNYQYNGILCAPTIYHEWTIEMWVPKK